MRGFLAAIAFLTRIPVPAGAVDEGTLGRAAAFFPAVGALLGLLLAGVSMGAEALWHSPGVCSALVIVTLVLATGGLHMDGLMDTCDGIFGGRTAQRALEIMKDSRVGAFGALGAMCVLLLKFGFISALTGDRAWKALILMPVVGRWALVYAIARFAYVRDVGTGRAFKEQVAGRHLVWASLLAAVIGAALLQLRFVPVAIAVWLVAWATGRYVSAKLGGLTGDAYGAIAEVTEVVALAAIPLTATMVDAL